MTTISLNDLIESQDLNRAFSETNQFYRTANLADNGYINLRFSFQGVVLTEGTQNLQTDTDAYQKFFRAPDDLEVMAAVVDFWGVNRMGYNTNTNADPDTALGTNFNIKVLGNFTNLDEEEGYPQTYKSTEFNLVKDIEVDFDEQKCLNTVSTSSGGGVIRPLSSKPDYIFCQANNQNTPSVKGPRKICYFPVDKSQPLVTLLRGAQYIIEVSHKFKDKDGLGYIGGLTGTRISAVQDVTCADLVLVCRTTRRRYS